MVGCGQTVIYGHFVKEGCGHIVLYFVMTGCGQIVFCGHFAMVGCGLGGLCGYIEMFLCGHIGFCGHFVLVGWGQIVFCLRNLVPHPPKPSAWSAGLPIEGSWVHDSAMIKGRFLIIVVK